eukprot:gene48966-54086_t
MIMLQVWVRVAHAADPPSLTTPKPRSRSHIAAAIESMPPRDVISLRRHFQRAQDVLLDRDVSSYADVGVAVCDEGHRDGASLRLWSVEGRGDDPAAAPSDAHLEWMYAADAQ